MGVTVFGRNIKLFKWWFTWFWWFTYWSERGAAVFGFGEEERHCVAGFSGEGDAVAFTSAVVTPSIWKKQNRLKKIFTQINFEKISKKLGSNRYRRSCILLKSYLTLKRILNQYCQLFFNSVPPIQNFRFAET